MDAKTLLLLTYHFPPSAAVAVYRMLGLVRYLPRFGWKTVVVGRLFAHRKAHTVDLVQPVAEVDDLAPPAAERPPLELVRHVLLAVTGGAADPHQRCSKLSMSACRRGATCSSNASTASMTTL